MSLQTLDWNDECGEAVAACESGSGWAHVRGFIKPAELAALWREVERVVEGPDDHPDAMYFYEKSPAGGPPILTRVERIWEALPSLDAGPLGARLRALAQCCVGPDPQLFKDKVNIRRAGSPGYAPHQDTAAGWESFAQRFLSIGIFFHESDMKSGGFEIVDSAHRRGRFNNTRGRMSDEDFDNMGPIPLVLQAGDLLLLDGEAPHRTGKNASLRDVYHLLLSFNGGSSGYQRDKYYSEKERSFAAGATGNRYGFRVFEFAEGATM